MTEPSTRAALGATPIPGDRPAGQSVADDADYEAIRREIMKEPAKGEVTNWAQVVEIGARILTEKSKDLPTATYVAVALLNTDGVAGLLDGLRMVEGLLAAHWDQAFPPIPARLRARVNAVQYLSDSCQKLLGLREPKAADRDALLACLQACTDLEKVLEERFADMPVSLGGLTSTLREATARLPDKTQPQAAPAATAASSAGAPAGVAGNLAAGEVASRAEAEQLVLKSAAFFRAKEPTSAIAYRLLRVVRWSAIQTAPPVKDGRTELLDPASERVSGLRRLLDSGDWAGLLAGAEDAFRERPLWLDAQRYSDCALVGLGGPYAGAREGLLQEVRALLRRLPQLSGLYFQNGTAFADSDTKKWLQQEVGADEPAQGRASTSVGLPDSEEVTAAREEARELARKGRLSHALAKLDAALTSDGAPRSRFLARLELATLCSDSGKERVAASLLDGLDAEIQRHGLDEWEPGLAVKVLESLYRCRKRLAERRSASPDEAARVEAVFARICRIDPVTAASLE